MQITKFNNKTYQSKFNNNQTNNYINTPQDTVSFSGHLGQEKLVKKGVKYVLRHETALFRDMQTKNFVVNYINENFGHKSNIKMVIGGCCSGEEAYTYSMLLNSPRVSILGFDLSENAIKQAKSGEVLMQTPKKYKGKLLDCYTQSHKDAFLCFETGEALTPEQIAQKQLFDEHFDLTPEIFPDKETLKFKFTKWYMAKFLKIAMPSYNNRIVKIKDGKFTNCEFKTGDIMDLGKVTNGEKADIITFSNAMYHLTTNDIGNGMMRYPKENSEEIIRKIALQVKENLNPNGLFVLGENEVTQMMDSTTIPKVFKELGFEPLNKTDEHFVNVWRLVK